jgi:hypothetical protein
LLLVRPPLPPPRPPAPPPLSYLPRAVQRRAEPTRSGPAKRGVVLLHRHGRLRLLAGEQQRASAHGHRGVRH